MLSDRCLSVCLSILSVTLVYCGQTIGWIKMKLGMQLGLGPGHIVLDGELPSSKRGRNPQFSACICCGQMAGWIKMPLGREVRLSPSDIVLDGTHLPPQKKKAAWPIVFGPCLLWPNGCIDEDSTWYGSIDLSSGHIVLDGDPAPLPPRKGNSSPPLLGPCLLWPRSPISATADRALVIT